MSLKALAEAILARNTQRNNDATEDNKARNIDRATDAKLLRPASVERSRPGNQQFATEMPDSLGDRLRESTGVPSINSGGGATEHMDVDLHGDRRAAAPPPTSLHPRHEISGHWLISQPVQRIERWFTPPVSRGELEQRYPGGAFVPLPDTPAPPDESK